MPETAEHLRNCLRQRQVPARFLHRVGMIAFLMVSFVSAAIADEPLSATRAREALRRATKFMDREISDHGGYAWVSSADGRFSHGEGIAGPDRVWVQPPGTPAVGMAFLNAYDATNDPIHLGAAKKVGDALVQGQLRSGGWGYSIDFDHNIRAKIPYRVGPKGGRDQIPDFEWPGGWDVWRKRQLKTNKTLIDDDTTPAAIRFLAQLDEVLQFNEPDIHDAAIYALESTMMAQYPIGAWSHNYDRFPKKRASSTHYPTVKASYPETWSQTTTNDFQGCYMLNDRITLNMIETMLLAAEIYNDDRYWKSARRGGDFLIRAQLPDPQPAWAQQYDRFMKPVWDRKFEPPAITGGESQDAVRTLLRLYQATKDKKYLAPIPPALSYLKTCQRDDGKLSRYYELKTNRSIYFNRKYEMTYDDQDAPDHYAFVVNSKLASLDRDYRKLANDADAVIGRRSTKQIQERAMSAIAAQSADGSWLEPGFVRNDSGKKVIPKEGVVNSQTFIDHFRALAEFVRRMESADAH